MTADHSPASLKARRIASAVSSSTANIAREWERGRGGASWQRCAPGQSGGSAIMLAGVEAARADKALATVTFAYRNINLAKRSRVAEQPRRCAHVLIRLQNGGMSERKPGDDEICGDGG